MIILQNVGQGGVKIGRGHDCEIRVTDISVSRNHALIQKMGNGYIVFDNKSKFGTLVREPGLKIQLNSVKQGIQIGRTVMTFEKFKK
jgi:pSer/pThr/pTyr-binding forkhead associated (FHA) protein